MQDQPNETKLMAATYIGPVTAWEGQRALVRVNPENDWSWLVQFDTLKELHHGIPLTHHWHQFNRDYFKLDEQPT